MSLVLLDNSDLNKARWAELVDSSPQASFYHTRNWAELWEKSYKFCQAIYLIEEKGGEYRLGLPAVKIRKGGMDSFYSMPMGTYGGPVCANPHSKQLDDFMIQVIHQLPSFRRLRFQIVDFWNQFPFLGERGFEKLTASTQLIELSRIDLREIINKRGFQQAEKKGVRARRIQNEKEAGICYDLYLQTCQRHRIIPKYSELFYLNLFNLGREADWLVWWLAELDGKPLGYQINFRFKDQFYLWDAGSDPESLNLRGNDLLMGESLRFCNERGMKTYNLGGSPPGAEGLVHFKEQWGGSKKEYFIYEGESFLGKLLNFVRQG